MTAQRVAFVVAVWVIVLLAAFFAPNVAFQIGIPWPVVGIVYLVLLMLGTLVTLAIAAGYVV